MTRILADTHAWIWSFAQQGSLSGPATHALSTASHAVISSLSLYEISYKYRLMKWPEMAQYVSRLPKLAEAQGFSIIPATADICVLAGELDWAHRDPFDRIIVATAQVHDLTVITKDRAMTAFPDIRTLW